MNKYETFLNNFKKMDTYVEENFKVFAKNFESIEIMLSIKMDRTDFIKMDEEFKTLQKLKRTVDSKADHEYVKKMLAKLNNLIKELSDREVKPVEPKKDDKA